MSGGGGVMGGFVLMGFVFLVVVGGFMFSAYGF